VSLIVGPDWKGAARMAPGSMRAGSLAFVALLIGTGILTALTAVLSSGAPFLAVVPVLVVALVFAILRAPLRWTTTTLIFLSLALPMTGDAEGKWHTPLMKLGDLVNRNIDAAFPGSGLKVTGTELLLLALACLAGWRWISGRSGAVRKLDDATVGRDLSLIFLAGVGGALLNGLLRGGDFMTAQFQTRSLLAYPALYFLFSAAYRRPDDYRMLGRLLALISILRAVMAAGVAYSIERFDGLKIDYASNHWDSILFAVGAVILTIGYLERPTRSRAFAALVGIPLILLGMLANNRRLAWVELGAAAGTIFILANRSPWRHRVARALLLAAPVLALYLAIGWNSGSSAFKPVKMLRSTLDAKVDRSTWDREVENWNVVMSSHDHPILGRGYGFGYTVFVESDDISPWFPQFKAMPHNAILGWFLFAGVIGFTAMWAFFVGTVYLAVRAYARTTVPDERAATLCVVAAIVAVAVQAWGDMGPASIQSRMVGAMAAFVAVKLAVRSGAWPARRIADPRGAPAAE
jgi:hypothetical protein